MMLQYITMETKPDIINESLLLSSASEKKVKKEKKEVPKKIKTEDTGKQFEMAICLALNIPYDGPYNYDMELPEKLKNRLSEQLAILISDKLIHTAKKGSRYDFTSTTDDTIHLSAKTTKKGSGKVAPQVIGQSQPKKFCELLGCEFTNLINLKQYIQENITKILPVMVNYTFDCPNIYYNQDIDKIRYITIKNKIDWNIYKYKWTCNWDKWNNSSTLKIIKEDGSEMALVEFQIHSASRTNMAIRWYYDNVLLFYNDYFNIINI